MSHIIFRLFKYPGNLRSAGISVILFLAATGILWTVSGCEEQGSVGAGLFDVPVSFSFTDTLSIETSTVLMDSAVTQGTGTILFGAYKDDLFGEVTAEGYLKFSLGTTLLTPGSEARYDSLRLRMAPHYHYGDVEQSQKMLIHRVQEDIEPHEHLNALYNFNRFDHEPGSVAKFSLEPDSRRELEIRLCDELGRELFESARNDDPAFRHNSDFQTFFKGLVVKGYEFSNTAIIGVLSDTFENAEESNGSVNSRIILRLYYSVPGAEEPLISAHYDFPVDQAGSFSHIQSRKPAPLNQLVKADDMISSKELDNQVYIQSGIGLMTRIDFADQAIENLHNLAEWQNMVHAGLTVVPLTGSYGSGTPLPNTLRLLVADDQNHIIGQLQEVEGTIDHEFHRNTRYRFDITDFIYEQMETERYTGEGLLLATSSSNYHSTVDRLVLGDGKNQRFQMVMTIMIVALNE